MNEDAKVTSHSRRNRMIAIGAGAITVIAIVLGFAGDFLGLRWRWMHPAAELLLLAELVALVVVERHQLFEPVHGTVGSIDANVMALRNDIALLNQRLDTTGQMTFLAGPSQAIRGMTRAQQEALARVQETPQILRYTRLAKLGSFVGDPELGAELLEFAQAQIAFGLSPDSGQDAKARMWTVRVILAVGSAEEMGAWKQTAPLFFAGKQPINFESKFLVRTRSRPEAVLTANLITDRDVIVTLDDDSARSRWGFLFQGRQYVTLFSRWFDELWASIPDTYRFYSRAGLNEAVIEGTRKELEDDRRDRDRANH